MFGRFFLLLIVAGIVFFMAFWVLHLIISLPVFWAEKSKRGAIWNLFSNLVGIYMLCAWPAFCVAFTRKATFEAVKARWLYWLAAAILGFLNSVWSIRSQMPDREQRESEDSEAYLERHIAVMKFRNYLFGIATFSFVLSLVWPGSTQFLYGWLWSWLF